MQQSFANSQARKTEVEAETSRIISVKTTTLSRVVVHVLQCLKGSG